MMSLVLTTACIAVPPVDGATDRLEETASAPAQELPSNGPTEEDDESVLFADTGVLDLGIELDDDAIAALAAAPTE